MAYYDIDRYLGGITTGGGSVPIQSGATLPFTVDIPAGSTIRNAYLMAGRVGIGNNILSVTVTLTGASSSNHTFNMANAVAPAFTTAYGGNSNTHVIDVTAFILPTVLNYTLTVPFQTFGNGYDDRYTDFMFVIKFNNAALGVVNTVIYLNEQTMLHTGSINQPNVKLYNLSVPIPIDNTAPVAIGLMTGYICNWIPDAVRIKVNSTTLGDIRSAAGSASCGTAAYEVPRGNFSYYNSSLVALANCNVNQAMVNMDALSDIKALILNGATAFNLNFDSVTDANASNNLWGIIIAYHDTLPMPFECAKPNSVITSLITNNSARSTWTYPVMCSGVLGDVNFQYRVVGNTVWTVVPLVAVGQYDMAALSPNTNYQYQIVSTNCAGAVCAPSDIVPFTTL